jgi:hypothetical protein
VDTLAHAEQFLGLHSKSSITASAAVRDSSHGRLNRTLRPNIQRLLWAGTVPIGVARQGSLTGHSRRSRAAICNSRFTSTPAVPFAQTVAIGRRLARRVIRPVPARKAKRLGSRRRPTASSARCFSADGRDDPSPEIWRRPPPLLVSRSDSGHRCVTRR